MDVCNISQTDKQWSTMHSNLWQILIDYVISNPCSLHSHDQNSECVNHSTAERRALSDTVVFHLLTVVYLDVHNNHQNEPADGSDMKIKIQLCQKIMMDLIAFKHIPTEHTPIFNALCECIKTASIFDSCWMSVFDRNTECMPTIADAQQKVADVVAQIETNISHYDNQIAAQSSKGISQLAKPHVIDRWKNNNNLLICIIEYEDTDEYKLLSVYMKTILELPLVLYDHYYHLLHSEQIANNSDDSSTSSTDLSACVAHAKWKFRNSCTSMLATLRLLMEYIAKIHIPSINTPILNQLCVDIANLPPLIF